MEFRSNCPRELPCRALYKTRAFGVPPAIHVTPMPLPLDRATRRRRLRNLTQPIWLIKGTNARHRLPVHTFKKALRVLRGPRFGCGCVPSCFTKVGRQPVIQLVIQLASILKVQSPVTANARHNCLPNREDIVIRLKLQHNTFSR